MTFCRGLNALILGFAATLYLLIGIIIIAASGATFFTAYGEIFPPLYAGVSLGAGVVIFLVSVVGYLAACHNKWYWLTIFMIFDLLIIVLAATAAGLMFRYEDVLRVASEVNADGAVSSGLATLNEYETAVVETVVTNAMNACEGNTTVLNASAYTFQFACTDPAFDILGMGINQCFSDPVNATVGSVLYNCYESTVWNSTVALVEPPTTDSLLDVLNTPKGVYCACSSTIMNDFILRYIGVSKYVAIAAAAFFVLIFLSCCYLCCCVTKPEAMVEKKDKQAIEFNQSWQAGSQASTKSSKGKKKGQYSEPYMARP